MTQKTLINHSGLASRNQSSQMAPILYGQNIYLRNLANDKTKSLWGRGFMDKNVYLSSKSQQIQSQFTIEPKKGLYSFEGKTRTPVAFGAEVLIKHALSQEYISIGESDEMPFLQFQKQQSSSCYFQFVPLRTFQSNGNIITTQSLFLILNTERKLYITELQNLESLPSQPISPTIISKKLSKDETSNYERPITGSAMTISVDDDDIIIQSQETSPVEGMSFKKKSPLKKTQTLISQAEQMVRSSKNQYSFSGVDERNYKSFHQSYPTKIKRVSSFQPAEQNILQPTLKQRFQRADSKKQSHHENLSAMSTLLNQLPIYSKEGSIGNCSVQNYSYSEWRFEHVNVELKTDYLNMNDYIYFTHSQSNEIMAVDIEKFPPEVCFVKNTNQSENQYILSSIFVVEIEIEVEQQNEGKQKDSNKEKLPIESEILFKIERRQSSPKKSQNNKTIQQVNQSPSKEESPQKKKQSEKEQQKQKPKNKVQVIKKNVYLKHFLTGKYFPILKFGEEKKKCELVPLLEHKKNQYPPFKILFNGQPLQKSNIGGQKQTLHGFWLNKIPKTEIAEIMSLQNINKNDAIQYLKDYLKQNTRRRQKILRQFFYIPKLVSELVEMHQVEESELKVKKYYQLLFYLCRNNEKSKKQCLKYVQQILRYPQKQLILDLLTELLIENSNSYAIEKAITPSIIQEQFKQFIKLDQYSVSFMRIFRVFCGSEEQPSIRNQCLLFNLFFWDDQVLQKSEAEMTQSVLQMQRKVILPGKFKFKIIEHEGSIYFSNGKQQQKYENLKPDIVEYLRQYYYLLSDCMNGNNYPLIKIFTSTVTFNFLLKLLSKQNMKGPILSLIYNAYLKPQKKYKPQIFHKDYQKICEKGSLISYCSKEQQSLKQFIKDQINSNKMYRSTTYRILLNIFKTTIQNGYWSNFDDLVGLMNCLNGVIEQPQTQNTYHITYEEKASDRNLLRSKITAISIKIVLIEMQVSLWASDFITGVYTEAEIERKLVDQIKLSKNWVIDQKILRLCSTNSPQLLRKSILLLYKIYNLYKQAHKTYEEAQVQKQSKIQLTNLFSILQIKQEMKIDNLYCIIAACVKDCYSMQEISPKNLQKNYRNLESLLKYKQVNEQVQNMAHKLGLQDMLISDIKRYQTYNKKIKEQQDDLVYWKLLALYSTIRNNLKLRDIIAEHRKIFISFLESESPLYYVSVDIIEEIYRNNRKLIISDNQQLKSVCKCIDSVCKYFKVDLRFCKVVNLLSVFIETGNRKIMENHQIILQYVFTKNFVSELKKIMKSITLSRKDSFSPQNKQDYFRHVLQVVIYDLLVTMGQKKLVGYFDRRPTNQTIYSLFFRIGTNNWSLKSKTFFCINMNDIKEDIVVQFMRIILYDLNIMCESLKISDEEDTSITKEVKIYVSNIGKILDTIEKLFKVCEKKLEKQCEEEVLVIKIVQRLYIIKGLCPEIVHGKIDNLLYFISIIETRLKRKSQYFQLKKSLKKIEIKDFERNEIKDKLPLIYGDKIKNKAEVPRKNLLEQKNSFVQEVVRKKLKLNDMNKSSFEMTEDKIKELKTLILSLSYVNKNDSTLLSDNIKEFLVNFLRVSFLEVDDKELVRMQDILVNYEVPTIVCSILEEPFKHRYKLFCSTFELGIKLLEGGHSKCQQKFLQKFKEDSKNWIFQNMYQIIFDSLATMQFYYHYKDDPTIKSYEMILELEEYYTCKQQRKLSCQLLGKTFRFLQLLCENNNHVMKQYVYNQFDKEDHIKYMTKNFIQIAQRILDGVFVLIQFNLRELKKMPNQRFEEEVRANIFYLPVSILDFLVEVCQIPAEQNQLYLCRTDFLDFVRKLIDLRKFLKNYQQYKNKDWSIFFLFQKKLIILLKSLLEQNSEQISNLLRKKIGNSQFQFFIEQSFFHGGLEDTFKLKQMLTQMQLNGYVQNIVDVLIVKKILKIQEPLNFETQKLLILNELSTRIQSIHVDFKDHSLTVYFPFHPLFTLLSKKTKDFMLDRSAGLTTRRQKLTELLISREVIYEDINQQQHSQKKLMNTQKMSYLFNFALILCYLIIMLLVLFYSVGKSGAVLDIYEVQIVSGLSYLEFMVSATYMVLLGLNTFPVAKEKIKAYLLRRRQDSKSQPSTIQVYLKILKTVYIDEPESTHALILFLISFYACLFQIRVYSFSLIFAFAKIEVLDSILKSIRLTWQQLIFVCLLALAFSFIFGFITLNYYIGPLYENQEIDIDIDRINEHCNSIITCVSSLYTQKIIGESVSRQDEEYNYGRFVSDLVYWGFFQILLSNIIAAIIIDKFAEQRNAKQKIEHQRYSKCYICFADRNTLERRGEDFMSHVNNVHNLWNYFFYMYTLENLKDITDFTGIQYWINRQVKHNEIDWIPIDDSFKDEDASLHQLVEKLKPLLLQKEEEK